MADGDDTTISQEFDNIPTDTVPEVVEEEVINGALGVDPDAVDPGVNSRYQ